MIVHNYYQERGGEDAVYEAEAGLLEERGHVVYREEFYSTEIEEQRTHRESLRLAINAIWSRSSAQRLKKSISSFNPDVVHFHNTFPLISPSAYSVCKQLRVPVVQTLHNYRMLCANAVLFRDGAVCEDCLSHKIGWPGIQHACYRGSRAATAVLTTMQATHWARGTWKNDVDLYLALSNHSREIFVRSGLPTERVVVKPHFAVDMFQQTARNRSGAVFVGRLSVEKGISTLLKGWEYVQHNMPLRIVGDGPLAPLVLEASKRDPRIEWLGRQGSDSVIRHMQSANVLISPSVCYETFGRTTIEAFSSGTPVIASTSGPVEDLVRPGETGWHFASGDPVDLARVVNLAFVDLDRLSRMGVAARDTYLRDYTPERGYAYLLECYRRAVEQHACALSRSSSH